MSALFGVRVQGCKGLMLYAKALNSLNPSHRCKDHRGSSIVPLLPVLLSDFGFSPGRSLAKCGLPFSS